MADIQPGNFVKMVKFAEAEKRRGGDGGDRRLAPVAMLERPKMSRGQWESLKAHIMKERRRKKEEIEADEEEKRMRKERENRKKQHAMTLEETREQITKEELKLTNLQAQKHNMVQQLKKVLNEDQHRKEQEKKQEQQQMQQFQQQQQEMIPVHSFGQHAVPLTGHQMIFPQSMIPSRSGNIPLYKMGGPTAQPMQNMLSSNQMKRSRSPSPPSQSYHQVPFIFKNNSGAPASVVPVPLSSGHSGLHPAVDHKGKPIGGSRQNMNSFPSHPQCPDPQEKYYNVRPHLVLHSGGMLPMQQPNSVNHKGPPALTGFPVRGPPTSTQSPHTGVSSSHSYSGLNLSRNYF